MTSAATRWLVCLAGAAALLASGCGSGSRHEPAATSAGAPARPTVTSAPAPHPRRVTAHRRRGRPRAHGAPSAAPARTTAPTGAARRRFVHLASSLCSAGGQVRMGPPPASPEELRAYAAQALPRIQTISLVLERLSGQSSGDARVAGLVRDYQTLEALYRQAASGGAPAAAALIPRVQAQAAAAAMALDLGPCAPVPPPG